MQNNGWYCKTTFESHAPKKHIAHCSCKKKIYILRSYLKMKKHFVIAIRHGGEAICCLNLTGFTIESRLLSRKKIGTGCRRSSFHKGRPIKAGTKGRLAMTFWYNFKQLLSDKNLYETLCTLNLVACSSVQAVFKKMYPKLIPSLSFVFLVLLHLPNCGGGEIGRRTTLRW